MGSAELMLFTGLILAGVAVYLFMTSILAGKPGEAQLQWASGTEPVLQVRGGRQEEHSDPLCKNPKGFIRTLPKCLVILQEAHWGPREQRVRA